MKNVPTYGELAELLANYVYENWYREEPGEWHKHAKPGEKLPPVQVFDHMFSSMYQLCAFALEKLKITKFIDGSRSVFLCAPEDFKATAERNKAKGCSYDTLVVTLIDITQYDRIDDKLVACLANLGICEPEPEQVPAEFSVLNFDTRQKIPVKVVGVSRPSVVWTERKKYYDEYGREWTKLI